MTVSRRGRRTRVPPWSVSNRRSAEARLRAHLAGERSPTRRARRKSAVQQTKDSLAGTTEISILSLAQSQRQACPLNVGETTMQQTRARQILQSLIQGIDPVTSEELPHETVLHHADVMRALLAGLSALEQTAARAQRRAQLPDNVGRAWTTDEESRLVAAFKSGDSPITIAHEHGRTLRAIEARLEKLGLITAEQRTTRGGFTGAD